MFYMTIVIKVIWRKTLFVSLQRKDHEIKIVFSFYVVLFQFFVVFLFENKSIKRHLHVLRFVYCYSRNANYEEIRMRQAG